MKLSELTATTRTVAELLSPFSWRLLQGIDFDKASATEPSTRYGSPLPNVMKLEMDVAAPAISASVKV